MKPLYYLFYRLEAYYRTSKYKSYEYSHSLFVISATLISNIVLIIFIANKLLNLGIPRVKINDDLYSRLLLIIFFLIPMYAICYRILAYNNKYPEIVKMFEYETKTKATIGKICVVLYIIFSTIGLPASIILINYMF